MSSGHNDINDAGPSSLDEMIGQKSVIAQVRVAIDAAKADGKKFDHAALVGPPGLGKTQLARVIATEMQTEFIGVLGQSITTPADLNAVLLGACERAVVFFDEAHELEREFQTSLYLALDQKRVCVNGGRAGRPPQAIPLRDFTVLLATTDEFCLLAPLRDRARLLLRFDFYSDDELTTLLRQRSESLGWRVDGEVLPLIAERSRRTPRLGLRLLQACRRVCRAEGRTAVTVGDLERACALEGIDSLGLGTTERQYLRAVAAGNSRLNVIASQLGLPPRTVSHVLEPFLLRVNGGLVVKDDQGRRQLTEEGREHLARCNGEEERDDGA